MEIFEDKQTAELAHEILTHLVSALDDVTGAVSLQQAQASAVSAAKMQHGPTARSALSAAAASAKPDPHAGLTARVFLCTPGLAEASLSILLRALTWPAVAGARSSATLLHSQLHAMIDFPAVQVLLADGSLARATFDGLGIHGEHADCETALLSLAACVYRFL